LLRMFGLPVVLLLCLNLTATVLSQISMQRIFSTLPSVSTPVTNSAQTTFTITSQKKVVTIGPRSGPIRQMLYYNHQEVPILIAIASGASTAGNLIALCWFGMWMGMTSRTSNLATLKTFLFVQVIPMFVLYFVSTMVTMLILFPRLMKGGAATAPQVMTWYPLITAALTAALALAKDFAFFVWSRKKLYSSFRDQAARTLGQPRLTTPPPFPQPIPTPPVITAYP